MWFEDSILTTIACNKEEIVCDLQFTNTSTGEKWKGKPKIFLFEPHEMHYPHSPFYVGFAGTARDMISVADFFSAPEEYDELPKMEGNLFGLVLTAKREIFIFDKFDSWLPVDAQFAAIGSGAPCAKGAMAAGMTPREAVKIAMRQDAFTGFGVKSFNFK